MPASINQNEDFLLCEEIIDTTDGEPFISGGSRQYTRRWHVIVKKKDFGAGSVCSCDRLPKPYSIYQTFSGKEFDDLAVLVRYHAKRIDGDEFYHWLVTGTYSTEVPEGGIPTLTNIGIELTGSQAKPWEERPIIEWDWEETTEVPQRDLDGKAYLNSANMPFMPAPSFPTARNVLVLTRNEASFDRVIATKYRYSVNSDTFLGAEPGTVKCLPPRMKQRNRGPLQYYQITYRLVFNLPKMPDPPTRTQQQSSGSGLATIGKKVKGTEELQSWQPELLDQGTHQLQKFAGLPFEGEPVPIIKYGSPASQPVLLDGAGRVLKPNADGILVPKYITFRRFPAVPFKPIIERGIFGGV